MNPKIGIIGGKGRLGRLFADFFRKRGITVKISDKKTSISNIDLAKTCDITIVSVPMDLTRKVIKEVRKHVPKDSALMDFTSVKEMPVKEMLKGKCEVLGLHPMFGDSNPVPGQTVILTPTRKSKKWSKWMEDFLHKNKVKIQILTPRDHDKMMSVSQGLIHFADIAFADALRRTKISHNTIFKFSSKASELKVLLAARLIDQDPGLYANIQILNPNTKKSLLHLKKATNDLLKIVKSKNIKKFTKYIEKNKKYFNTYTKEALKDSSYLIKKRTIN